jgi:murein DD-endopeptidase MepM/ murein hydrolase activator NlpD
MGTETKKLHKTEVATLLRTLFISSCMWFFLFGAAVLPLSAQYPEIALLENSDVLYKQLTQDISTYYKQSSVGGSLPSLQFFRYRTKEEISLFALAARLNLPYESIATINHIDHSCTIEADTTLIIPNLPGVFVPIKPENELHRIISTTRQAENKQVTQVTHPENTEPVAYYFYPGSRFVKTERSYFLNIFFHYPMRKGRISSGYGFRISPFTGEPAFHGGIDIVGPRGSEVLAAREGTVKQSGYDPVFGHYIILSHSAGYETMYGHLEKNFVELNQQVNSGMLIGTLGNSGLSTGPHLHFEVRRDNKAIDPIPLLER